jgi:hypothetical protein
MWVYIVFDEYGVGSIVFDEPAREDLPWSLSHDTGVRNGQAVWLNQDDLERHLS